ncbi:MAG: TPR end-of-group domain-containing protein, partial [Bacteroidales bacterium]
LGLAMYYISHGQKKKAEPLLQYAVEHYKLQMKRFPRLEDKMQLLLAKAYSLLEDKKDALKVLGNIIHYNLYYQSELKYNPLFDPIRNEPGFTEILSSMEKRYRTEREKARKLLVELGEI